MFNVHMQNKIPARNVTGIWIMCHVTWTMSMLDLHISSWEFCFQSIKLDDVSCLDVLQLCVTEDCWIQAKFYLGLQQDEDLQDGEPFCFSILVGHGQSHTFSVDMTSDLAVWEKSFQRAVFMEVQRVGVCGTAKWFVWKLCEALCSEMLGGSYK